VILLADFKLGCCDIVTLPWNNSLKIECRTIERPLIKVNAFLAAKHKNGERIHWPLSPFVPTVESCLNTYMETTMLNIKLDRPIAFFDIEATGISPRADRIVELCIIKLMPDKTKSTHTFRINPQIPIPSETTDIHGISDADVADCPTFPELAKEIADVLEGCDLGGFNIGRFDIPMLSEEFIRADVPFGVEGRRILDAQRIFHQKEPRDLSAALSFYCGELHLDAHGAEPDVIATIKVFQGQLDRYPDLPHDMDALDEFCNPRNPTWVDRTGRLRWTNGEVALNFGRKKGELLKDLVANDPGFIKWMLRSDFPADTREIVENGIQGIWPTKG
jgi:DNA polymerase III subunit epsilon